MTLGHESLVLTPDPTVEQHNAVFRKNNKYSTKEACSECPHRVVLGELDAVT
jgi:hypothetical protein